MQTAKWAAAQRARETERPDALFRDPLAAVLAGEDGRNALAAYEQFNQASAAATAAFVAIRTRFYDEMLMRAAAEGVRQVAILGAGMDARAFRLEWPAGTTVYELDRREVVEAKARLLEGAGAQPRCARVAVGTDLVEPWGEALAAAGFSAPERSAWVAEGFFYYLDAAGVDAVLAQVSRAAAPGSWLGGEMVSASFYTHPWMKPTLQALAERGMAWRFGTDDPEELFARHGWRAEVKQAGEEGSHFGRWNFPIAGREMRELPHNFLVTGRRCG